MAIEPRRGCGYRKVAGLYLVADGAGRPCCRMPIELHICPTCSHGIKPARGWTWVDLAPFMRTPCRIPSNCPLEQAAEYKSGLLWIGEQFYPSPEHFEIEAATLGISRRISKLPRGFVVGETWVALAHRKAIKAEDGYRSGVFKLFRPARVELIVTETQFADAEAMDKLRMRGITPVPVPDDDPDHRGTAYDVEPATDEGEAE